MALALLVVIGALLVLFVGWFGGNQHFIRLAPGLAAMVPSSALGFVLLGGALAWREEGGRHADRVLAVAGLSVATVAALDIAVIASGTAIGIDSLFIPTLQDGRREAMSIASAVSFLLAGICALLLSRPLDSFARKPVTVLATLGLYLPATSLVGHLFDVEALLALTIFETFALHTALLMTVLFLAMMVHSRRGWIFILFGPGEGSRGARRLLFPVVLLPALLVLLALDAARADYFEPSFRATLLAVALMTIGLAAVLRNAYLENRSERRLAQTMFELESTIQDKNLLIREIHHRVKNNLQQITALVAIEAAKFVEPEPRAPFEALEGRVQALGLVHQLLMQSQKPSEINIARFLNDLGDSIRKSHYLIKRDIALTVEAAPDQVQLDAAISLGLLINELVVNAVKHAFPDNRGGRIAVIYGDDPVVDGHKRIIVADSGCGIDVKAATTQAETGGTRIIRSLVTQLHGNMDVKIGEGTSVSISFPDSVFDEFRYAG